MDRSFPLIAIAMLTTYAIAVPIPSERTKFAFVDLQPKANSDLKKTLGDYYANNVLTGFTEGEKTLDGVRFKLGAKYMSLGSSMAKDKPEKIEGIQVGKKCVKMYVLHATQWGRGDLNNAQLPGREKDGATIGEYKVNYEDKSTISIPIVYGNDVRDWWYIDDEKESMRGKIAWSGESPDSKRFGAKIRLYQLTWTNPHPEKKIASIDYISKKETSPCAPFCLAITLAEK